MSVIQIRSTQQWIIEGPGWVTNLPFTGAGDYDFEPICGTNETGSYVEGLITIDYGTTLEEIPIVQYYGTYINAKVFILGLDEDEGQYVHYMVSANDVDMDDTNTVCGSSMDFSGYAQTSVVPLDGAKVYVKAYAEGFTVQAKQFQQTLNNAIYWLSAPEQYDNGEDVITAGAAAITTSFDGGTNSYNGSFNYSYSGDYYYIVFDYRNQLTCGGSNIPVTSNGSFYPIYLTVDYGTAIGMGEFSFLATFAVRLLATYDGSVVGEDITSGDYKFVKLDTAPATMLAEFSNDETPWDGTLEVTSLCVSLTSTAISDTGYTTSALACAANGVAPTLDRWHNGADATPVVGDIIYTASNGSTKLDGDDKYWYVYGEDYSLKIDSNGVVLEIVGCTCSEVAVPVITATNYYIQIGSADQIRPTATNNPTSWAIVSAYSYYAIGGGASGCTIQYTDEYANVRLMTLGINEEITIAATTGTVSSTYGTTTITYAGTYYKNSITIDNDGNISINSCPEGTYVIQVNATNCFGTSSDYSIVIYVKSDAVTPLKSFSMDSEGMTTDVLACALTSCNTQYWFKSNIIDTTTTLDPEVNDIIFIDPYGEQYFNGGYLYYKTSLNNYLLIDGIGQVIDKNTC